MLADSFEPLLHRLALLDKQRDRLYRQFPHRLAGIVGFAAKEISGFAENEINLSKAALSDDGREKRPQGLEDLRRLVHGPEPLEVLVLPGESLANALNPRAKIEG